jgi:UDP-N-acetyl-2-amino-2-deoxyglucuronate dehydrogenase
MSATRFAILGSGHIGQRHALHAAQHGQLVAVCDLDLTKAIALANTYSAKALPNLESLLSIAPDLDLVAICTPNGLHAEHAIACMQAGLNVLVEKPMAIALVDCERMMEVAKQADTTIFTVVQNRFNPPVAALKAAMDAGKLGQIQNIQINCFWNRPASYYQDSWHGTADLDGGILFTQFSHFIDLLYWLFGDVQSVHALANNFQHQTSIDREDAGAVLLQMASGAIASIHYSVNAYAKNAEGSLTVLAEKGTVKIGGEYLNTIAYQSLESGPLLVSDATNAPNQYGTYQGSMSNHGMVYANLVAALQGRETYYATAEEALKTVEIIERIHQSINLQS